MKTGREPEYGERERSHKMAIVTGATGVFMQDLCADMARLHALTGDEDMAGIAHACAARLLQSQKCRELETIVHQVLEHDDGMPVVANKALLANVMACYSDALRAERTGTAAQYRRETLIPAIVAHAMPNPSEVAITDEDATKFVNSINAYTYTWEHYVPTSPFQIIICNAINKLVS